MALLFLFKSQYLQNSFQKESDLEHSLLNIAGATPLSPLVGMGPIPVVVVVAWTDMVTSGRLGGCMGIVGPNERAAVSIEGAGLVTAGEFGS
jgi:hypothetical protein